MRGKSRKAQLLRKCYWLCLLCLTMAAAASSTNAQYSVNVTATAGAVTPDWDPAPTDPANPAVSPLSATVANPPTAPYPSCPIQGPTWQWSQGVNAQYSADNVTWTSATSGSYSAWIVQPYTTSPAATLNVLYNAGGYWQFTCNVSVRYNDGGCGNTWVGAASATANGRAVQLVNLTVVAGATQTKTISGGKDWATVKQAGATVIAKATTVPDNDDGWSKIDWTGGSAVPGSANMRSVDKSTSALTTVFAKIGSTSDLVNIWIIWSNLTIQIAGNRANDNNAPSFADNGGNWPANYGGGTALGAIDHDAVPGLTYSYTIGKIQVTGLPHEW